jgi:ribonuclease HII
MRRLGIDEAGRGCVLGPLVVCAFVIEDVDDEALRHAGADDSKRLSHDKRHAARTLLAALGTPMLRVIDAARIDSGNLNSLEEDAIVDLVRSSGVQHATLDALGHPGTFKGLIKRLTERTDAPVEWVVEPKADATYAVVGAASIFAKTHRDEQIARLSQEFGALGSGYPSDPVTKQWLRSWSDSRKPWPAFVRTRWATISALSQQSLF